MDAAQVLKRQNLRGLVKCKACNHYNGIRATACKNKQCKLSKNDTKPKLKPKINAIQLANQGESQLFSVQIRDRDVDSRNFVSVTDKVISSDASASIINRNAICYVDTCKYDSNDINISCKHVKHSLESCTENAKVQQINEDILKRLQMTNEKRQKLLAMLRDSPSSLSSPLVQRVNQRVFVVSCDVSLYFPIGLLHVVCIVEPKGVWFSCACHNVNVQISPKICNLMDEDICEHILLILAAILSDFDLQHEFEQLITAIHPFLNTSIAKYHWNDDESSAVVTDYNDLDSTAIAATLVDSLDNIELIQISNDLVENETLNSSFFSQQTFALDDSDENNMGSVDTESMPISVDSENIPANEQMNCDTEYSDPLDLGDYKVQLMDQFSVTTDQVEFGHNNNGQLNTYDNQSNFDICDIDDIHNKPNDIVLSYLCPEDVLFEDLPFEVMETLDRPTSSKECPIKTEEESCTEYEKMCQNLDGTQFESYQNWLDSVIETMNLVLDFNNDGHPDPLKFCVPHLYFDIFRTKFSAGTKKKRMPNFTTIITEGRYKNLTLFTWIFSNMKLIKHIFSTKSMELEVVRSFRKTSHNTFEYISARDLKSLEDDRMAIDSHNRRIRPTIYKTFLKLKGFENKFQSRGNKHGMFIIEWIPNVLPLSKHGEMHIKLQYGHMKNDTLLQ